MSRRSRYARVHNAATRSPRVNVARPEVARPGPIAPAATPELAQLSAAPTLEPVAPAAPTNGHGQPLEATARPLPRTATNGHAVAVAEPPGCTAPQLRRFIKSRTYVPMHELRRRFGINGHEDDVCAIDLGERRVYVGLPVREGSLLGELLRGGDIGYELSMDPQTPVVVGLYPMRPVART